jgi:hypothetical protein
VSNHLSCLLDCGLVKNRREGKNIIYSLRNKKVSKILEESDAILSELARGIFECVNPTLNPEGKTSALCLFLFNMREADKSYSINVLCCITEFSVSMV